MQTKGFTLIELLVVIAILVILSVAVILTLNPAQLLKQSRDSTRIQDMASLKSAVSFYLADVNPLVVGSTNTCYGSSVFTPGTPGCGGRMVAATVSTTTVANQASTTGAGWMPINFAAISSGSPLGSEPVDPVNDATYFYSYATNGSPQYQFEIDADMESTKYADVESKDGGTSATLYEVGTHLGL